MSLKTSMLAAGLACITIASAVNAGTIRDDRKDSRYTALASQYQNVGEVRFSDSDGSFLASGTVIGDRWVLTAGHVVDAGTDISRMTFQINGQTYNGSAWAAHPGWKGDLSSGKDIGIIRLDRPVTDVTPATLYTGNKEKSQLGTFVGYGTTGDGQDGWKQGTGGTLRAGQNRVDSLGNKYGYSNDILLMDFDNPHRKGLFALPPFGNINRLGKKNPVELEYSIAPGDSGGGMFINVKGKGPQLAGVNSFGGAFLPPFGDNNADSSYGDYFGVTRVSRFADWIGSEMALGDGLTTPGAIRGNDSGQSSGPRIIFPFLLPLDGASVPEPTALALLSGLAGLLLLRRRTARESRSAGQ